MQIGKKTRVVVITAFVIMVVLPLLIGAVIAVSRGQGMQGYRNVYGLFMSWVSLLILVGAFGLAILAALIARAVYYWRIRRGI